jgi:hypothetical protein
LTDQQLAEISNLQNFARHAFFLLLLFYYTPDQTVMAPKLNKNSKIQHDH